MFAAYLVMLYYAPNLTDGISSVSSAPGEVPVESGAVPRWVYLINGVAMLVYQTLDNMDGKQARKTSSSSPLGMLFDHGCDAINSPMGSINWCVAMAIGPANPIILFWTLISSAIPFYVSTWEEYYTGALVLPIINGPSEGLILGASLSFVSYCKGPQFWHGYDAFEMLQPALDALPIETPEFGYRNYELLIALAAFCAIQELTLKSISVVHNYGFAPLLNIAPFLALLGLCVSLAAVSPETVQTNPRTCMLLFGTLFVDLVTTLMLDHMTGKDFRAFRKILIPFFCILALAMSSIDVDVTELVKTYLISAATYMALRLSVVTSEICEALGIWCFDITTPRKGGKRA